MSELRSERRVVAEIDFGRQPASIVWVGPRPLHHFWPLLSPYFRDVLLTPQRRSDEDSVAWHWHEPAETSAPRASELAGLRKRLAADQQAFIDNLAREARSATNPGGLQAHAHVDELGSVMETTIARLIALPDATLARFVCRTDAGLRVHSWNAPAAATPHYLDEEEIHVSGMVIARGKRAVRCSVVLADDRNAEVARVETDGSGRFCFKNVSRGAYHLRVASDRAPVSENALRIVVERSSLEGIRLHRDEDSPAAAPRFRRRVWATVFVALLMLAAASWRLSRQSSASAEKQLSREEASSKTTPLTDARVTDAAKSPSQPYSQAKTGTSIGPQNPGARVSRHDGSVSAALTATESTSRQSEVARELVLPGSDPALPASAAGPAPAGATIAASTPPATTPTAGSRNVSGSGGAPSDASDIPPEPGSIAIDPAADAEAASKQPTPAHLRRATAPPAERVDARVRNTSRAVPSTADDSRDSPPSAVHDNDHATNSSPRRSRPNSAAGEPVADDAATPTIRAEPTISPTHVWQQTIRLRLSPWRERLLSDAILPTLPRPVGTHDDLQALRDEAQRAKAAEKPISFRQPRIHLTVTLESSSGDRTCVDLGPIAESASTLRTNTGAALAHVQRAADGDLTLQLAPDVAARLSLAFETAPEEASSQAGAPRFQWQLGGGMLAADRCDIPLTSSPAAPPIQFATLQDRLTGWALTAEIRLRVERSD